MTRSREIPLWTAGGAIAVTAAVVVAVARPELLLIIPAILALYLVKYSWFRLAWFVAGALLVFQVGEGLTLPKLIYVFGTVVCAAVSAFRMRVLLQTPWAKRFRPAVVGAGILIGYILIATSIHSLALNNVDPVMWARDALTYLLAGAAVLIGVDAASSTSLKAARTITITLGLVSAIGYASTWIQARGYVDADYERAFLSSMVALTLPIALCLALGLAGGRFKPWWVLLGSVLIVAVLITGTRTGIVLGVVLIGMIGAASKQRISFWKALVAFIAGVAVIIVLVPIAAALFSSTLDVQSRFDGLLTSIGGGFAQDASGAIRIRATEYSLEIFRANQFFGHGLGTAFPNPNPNSQLMQGNFSLDTPAMYLAKFGVFGVAVVLVSFGMIVYAAIRHERGTPWLLESTAGSGAVLVWIALLPLASTTEDKGFAISLALLMMLVGAAARSSYNDITDAVLPDSVPSQGGSNAVRR